MIKVTISTMVAVREDLPDSLIGLDAYTLQNLQAELNPVPDELVGIEYWSEITVTPDYDPMTEKLEGEALVANAVDKTVTATAIVVPYTPPIAYETVLSKTDFKGMFTPTEYRAISNAAATDDDLFQFWDMAQTADNIDVEDARTIGGVSYLAVLGILTDTRRDEILLGKLL